MVAIASFGELEKELRRVDQTSVSDDEESAALGAVRQMADSPEFDKWLSALPREAYGMRMMVYEALVVEAERFESLLARELAEAIRLAPTFEHPRDVLEPFLELCSIEAPSLKPRFRDRIRPLLDASRPSIRAFGIELIEDFLESNDRAIVRVLWDIFQHDPDWRPRHFAWKTLTVLGELPKDHPRPLLDRLRARWFSPRK
jgi:hypothetical protein